MAQVIIDTSELSERQLRERILAPSSRSHGPDQRRAPGHQLRLQVRRPARGRPRVRRALHGEPVLHARAAAALGPDGAGPRVRAGTAVTAALPGHSCTSSSRSPIPAYLAEGKTRLTSPSAAPAASIARSPSPRPLAADLRGADLGPVSVWHRELERVSDRRDAQTSTARHAAALAAPGHRHQALAARRVPGRAAPRGRRRRWSIRHRCSARCPADSLAGQAVRPRRASSSCPASLRPFVVLAIGVAVVLRRPPAAHARRCSSRSRRARQPLVELLYQKRSLARGPRIVAIGGGTGLSTLLRGLKSHAATSRRS